MNPDEEARQDGYESQADVEFENVTNALFYYHQKHAELHEEMKKCEYDAAYFLHDRIQEVDRARVEARTMLELWTDERIERVLKSKGVG